MSEVKEYKEKFNRNRKPKKKVCQFCADKVEHIDYKDTAKLRRFVSEPMDVSPTQLN